MSAETFDTSHDHVVLLLDTPDFENPPAWLRDSFNIIEGGVHAGGSTRNKLIIFADGTYIELLNWIKEPEEFFDWAGKPPGLLDFALTTLHASAQENHAAITKRLQGPTHPKSPSTSSPPPPSSSSGDAGLGISYNHPQAGGRTRRDGKEVHWFVTRPIYDNDNAPNVPRPVAQYFPTGRLDAPFFCHDVTDRILRVPYKDSPNTDTNTPTDPAKPNSITHHPSGAQGILSIDVLVPEGHVENYAKVYAAITGAKPTPPPTGQNDGHPAKSVFLNLRSPDQEAVKGLRGKIGIQVRAPRDSDAEDEAWLKTRGVGIRELRLFVPIDDADDNKPKKEWRLNGKGIGANVVLVAEPRGSD